MKIAPDFVDSPKYQKINFGQRSRRGIGLQKKRAKDFRNLLP